MFPSADPSAPGPVPENLVRQIVAGEVTRVKGELQPPRDASMRVIRTESSHCLLASGPQGVVLNIIKQDGMYQRCTIAHAALTRRWHGIGAFSAKYLEQGGCPLPRSLGIVQRHLWFKTCYLADGREHKMGE